MRSKVKKDDRLAAEAVEHYGAEMFQRHRGVDSWRGRLVAFGNDAYKEDSRTREQVRLLREEAAGAGLKEAGFAVSSDGYSWALLFRTRRGHDDGEALNAALTAAWKKSRGITWDIRP